MRKKLTSLALALAMCLGLTVPAFATGFGGGGTSSESSVIEESFSLTLEDVAFSVDPIGVVTIQYIKEDGSEGAAVTAYMFDQPASVSMKDGRVFTGMCSLAWVNTGDFMGEVLWDNYEEISGVASIDITDDLTRFEFEEPPVSYWSPYMVSKSYVDSLIAEGRHKVDIQPYIASQPTSPSFSDVKASDYYAEPVAWAVEKGITAGTSATTFSPNVNCTQGQILTFLWRAKGGPNPTGTVSGTQYYATAAQWAEEQGLTDNFSAEADCTRAMVVTYLWKLAGSPRTGASGFTDVPATADYAQAVAWAVEQGITSGTSAATFSPDMVCTRGQIVTFLYAALGR